jgi:hypothetical protein
MSATADVIYHKDASDGFYVLLEANDIGAWIEFKLPNIEAGTYRFTYHYRQASQHVMVQTWTGGSDLGDPVDQFGTVDTFLIRNENTLIS